MIYDEKDGQLSAQKLAEDLQNLGDRLTSKQVNEFFSENINEDGQINSEDFIKLHANMKTDGTKNISPNSLPSKSELFDYFSVFDDQ